MLTDLLHAVRTWRSRPGLLALAVATLALGLGMTSAVFSMVNAVLLGTLPYPEPDRLTMVWASNPEAARRFNLPDKLPLNPAACYSWPARVQGFSSLACFKSGPPLTLTGAGDTDVLTPVPVMPAFFDVLGVPPLVGRTLRSDDDNPGASPAIVLAYDTWERRFAKDPTLVGRSIALDGRPYDVVGVMPQGVTFPRGTEMPAAYGLPARPDGWVALQMSAEDRLSHGHRGFPAIGRLRPGVDRGAAEAELVALSATAQREFPAQEAGWGARLDDLHAHLVGDLRQPLLLLLGAAALVVLIASANVASLLLVAVSGRWRELSVRTALGASRAHLVRQLLAESLLVAALAGALGVLIGSWLLGALVTLLPSPLAHLAEVTLDWRVAAFGFAVAAVVGAISGLAPALLASRVPAVDALRDSRGASAGGGAGRARRALVVAEVALAVTLLIGAGLLVRSFQRVLHVDPGFEATHVLALTLRPSVATYPERADLARYYDTVVGRLAAVPGVVAAGATSNLPLRPGEDFEAVTAEGGPPLPSGLGRFAESRAVTPGFFDALRIRVVKGRVFTDQDRAATPNVAVISTTLARQLWGGGDALGKRFTMTPPEQPPDWVTVVGVVADTLHAGLHAEPRPQAYVPLAQAPQRILTVAVRGTGDPADLVARARRAVVDADPLQPILAVETFPEIVASSVAGRRFVMTLLTAFAGAAAVLALVGLFGVTSYGVTLRTRELGVRVALGAGPRQVWSLVLGESLTLTALGIGLGLAIALALTRALSGMLFGIGAWDPVTFAGVTVLLLAAAAAACYLPGRRAIKVDPMVALRTD